MSNYEMHYLNSATLKQWIGVGFKFVIRPSATPLKEWLEHNDIQFEINDDEYIEDGKKIFIAIIEINDIKCDFVIITPGRSLSDKTQ